MCRPFINSVKLQEVLGRTNSPVFPIQVLYLRYNDGEIHFNLMAIVSDRKMTYEKKITQIQKLMEESGMETSIQQAEISRLRLLIEEEEVKTKQYQMENIRRKHNYLPLIVEILKILAKEGQLLPLYEKAKERAVEKETKREEAKA